jgi:hypothetical protein
MQTVTTIGLVAKSAFQAHGVNAAGNKAILPSPVRLLSDLFNRIDPKMG